MTTHPQAPAGATILFATALLAGCASTPSSSNRDDAMALARAESAFAAEGASEGVKPAFLHAMADDATLFRPGPVNGKAYMAGRPAPTILLEWKPQRVMVAASGEIGISTGPSKITSRAKPGPPSYGQFLSVWRKNDAGTWQLVVDHGIFLSKPAYWDRDLEAVPADFGPRPTDPITTAEARFSATSDRDGLVEAYRAHGSRYLRVLRDEQAPADGPASVAALAAVIAPAERWAWTSTDSGTAVSYDLGWSMGRYRMRDAAGAARVGYYLRVWRAEGGAWKVVSDVLAPIEETTK